MRVKLLSERCINLRAIFAGGGTGGHLFPAIAIADELKVLAPSSEILFVGTKEKIEARVVPQKGYDFRTIWISGFHRSLKLSNLLFPVKVIVSMMQAFSIIKEFRPDVVIGTGGYVSGPMLFAATLKSIPTLIQEQNSFPGETTRFLSKRVNEVHVAFEESKKYLPQAQHVFVSGNPTRKDLGKAEREESLRYFGFRTDDRVQTVLIFGGSLGAASINDAVLNHIDELLANNIRVIWQTGKTTDSRLPALRVKYSADRLWINTFIDRMDYAYAASDLVVCRAGATTIAELTLLGKPAVLVPFPRAAADHQTKNAKTLEQAGAAIVITDHEFNERMMSIIHEVLNNNVLERMSAKSKKLAKPDAARVIAQRIMRLKDQKG